MMGPAVLRTHALRVACVWGETVLALRTLRGGQSFVLGEHRHADFPLPEGLEPSPTPLKAVDGGWALDATGARGGVLMLRGRSEDPLKVGAGGPVPVMPGDHGLVQYGQFGLFFQYVTLAPPPPRAPALGLLGGLALVASLLLHGGALGLARGLAGADAPRPAALAALAPRAPMVRLESPRAPSSPPRALIDALEAEVGRPLGEALAAVPPVAASLLQAPAAPVTAGSGLAPTPSAVLPAGSTAPPLVDGGARLDAGVAAGLTSEQIRKVVVSHTAALRLCYEPEARKKSGLRGDVTVGFRIEPTGAVGVASVKSTSLESPPVEECLLRQVKTWKFPSAQLATEVSAYPFKFGG